MPSPGDTVPPAGTKANTQGPPAGAQGGATGGPGNKPNAQGHQGAAQGGASGGGRGTSGGGGTTPRPGSAATPVIDGNSLIHLTPQALQQLLANAVANNTPSVPPPAPKCPKFWEREPVAWFLVFRGHYEGRNFSQLDLFKALLPLLPELAISLCRPLVTSPTATVMDDAQKLLLAHYVLGPLERGRALVNCTSLGDRTPREMLQYMRSLQPGEQEGVMFRYVFVSLLPDVVREVVSSIDSLDDMAITAGNILQANTAASPRVVSVTLERDLAPPIVAAASRRPPPPSTPRLCRLHAKYGQDAIRCNRPSSCPMNVIRTTPLPGNAPAGRQ